jgi:hypothetical protein
MATTNVYAQFDSVQIGGYAMVQAPHDSVKQFTNRFSVLKVKGYIDGIRGDFQVDFASMSLVAAQGCIPVRALGENTEIYIGRTFSAAGQITPAPNQLNGKGWHPIFADYCFIEDGVGISYAHGPLQAYGVWGANYSVSATAYGMQVLWQDKFARTIAYQSPTDPLLHVFNVFGGKTFFYNGPQKNQVTACVNADIKTVRAYYAVNDGRTVVNATGIRWDITKHIRVKGQYNLMTDAKFFELVCSF